MALAQEVGKHGLEQRCRAVVEHLADAPEARDEIATTSAHFEQSFSADGGKTWEVNWITDQTRVE